jgi:hypothetical protein
MVSRVGKTLYEGIEKNEHIPDFDVIGCPSFFDK